MTTTATETEKLDPAKIEHILAGMHGTEDYHVCTIQMKCKPIVATDGVKTMADLCGAFWLLDCIASYQPQIRSRAELYNASMKSGFVRRDLAEYRPLLEWQFWHLDVTADRSACLTCKADTDRPNVVEQRIQFTDFPLTSIDIWVADGGPEINGITSMVMMLPTMTSSNIIKPDQGGKEPEMQKRWSISGRYWTYKPAKRAGVCLNCAQTIARGAWCWGSGAGRAGLKLHDQDCFAAYCAKQRESGKAVRELEPTDPAAVAADEHEDEQDAAELAEAVQGAGNGNGSGEALVKALRTFVEHQAPAVDEAKVREIVRTACDPVTFGKQVAIQLQHEIAATVEKAIEDRPPRKVQFILPDLPPTDPARRHVQFEHLLRLMTLRRSDGGRLPVWLYGPAGGFKTTAVADAAAALGLKFYPISVSKMSTPSQILGYRDATGGFVAGPAYHAFSAGGVLLVDEIDRGNDNCLMCINALTANSHCGFPCGTVERHADFVCVVAGNTTGYGSDRVYSAAGIQDAALLDRFVFLEWPYDEELEREIGGNAEWCKHVQSIRRACESLKDRLVVSPRATLHGAVMLAAGIAQSAVEEQVIWKGMDAARRSKITASVR